MCCNINCPSKLEEYSSTDLLCRRCEATVNDTRNNVILCWNCGKVVAILRMPPDFAKRNEVLFTKGCRHCTELTDETLIVTIRKEKEEKEEIRRKNLKK